MGLSSPHLSRFSLGAGLAAVLFASAACSGGAQQSAPPPTPALPPSAAAPAGAQPVQLSAAPTGTVTLSWDPNSKHITAAVDMHGFTPSSSHAMHIHPGSCANQTQPPSVPFPDLSADPAGAARQSVVSGPVPAGIPNGSYVNIHLAPSAQLGSPTDVSFTPIACADIPSGTPAAGPVTLTTHAPPRNGQTPAGTAELAYHNGDHTLRVEVKATGLPPNTAHAVHIHSGTCAAQGPVLYPVPDLKADSSGNGSVTATISSVTTAPPPTGWYVNVHFGPMSQILTGAGQPTLLFAPILCGNVG
jgi:hypothetical protein